MAPQLDSFFQQVDTMAESFIDRLAKAVAIPSVSADDDKRGEVVRVCVFSYLINRAFLRDKTTRLTQV